MTFVPPKPKNEPCLSLGEFLDKMRFSVSEFARLCDCNRGSIAYVRDGKHKPTRLLSNQIISLSNGWISEESLQKRSK